MDLIQSVTRPSVSSSSTHSKKTASLAQIVPASPVVAQGIQNPHLAQENHEKIQYDMPEPKTQRAVETYLAVQNQAKRDELAEQFSVHFWV
ncbi:MAG: hypothetical protein ACRC9T_01590 [Vibrionaceae bacterium]